MRKFLLNWNLARILRLLFGIAAAIYAVYYKEYYFLMLSALFLFQAIMNVSCCGASGCYVSGKEESKEVYKEQIKEYKPNEK